MSKQKINCVSCFKENLDKDIIALNKKLFGKETSNFYCIDCMANYFDTTTDELLEKIEEFKEEGCELFK